MTAKREDLGRAVRETWIEWAKEQPDAKSSWLRAWEELSPAEQEVGMRIGERLYHMGANATTRHFNRSLYR